MRRALAMVFALAPLTLGATWAPTMPLPPDPARAGMCRAFDGLAFTFCVAICEARLCDLRADDDLRCRLLRRGLARAADGATPPCEAGVPSAQARASGL